jgi:DENN (AEX-3) domain/Domain found in Dishevelled, Egl-10, and Pleckstrin (DEP)/uDENN domain/PH domain/dDENN domain
MQDILGVNANTSTDASADTHDNVIATATSTSASASASTTTATAATTTVLDTGVLAEYRLSSEFWSRDATLERIATRMLTDPEFPIGTHYNVLMPYRKSFVGSEAVQYLISADIASDEQDAIDIGNRLLAAGVLAHVHKEHPFRNERLFYRFRAHDSTSHDSPGGDATRQKPLPILMLHSSLHADTSSVPTDEIAETSGVSEDMTDEKSTALRSRQHTAPHISIPSPTLSNAKKHSNVAKLMPAGQSIIDSDSEYDIDSAEQSETGTPSHGGSKQHTPRPTRSADPTGRSDSVSMSENDMEYDGGSSEPNSAAATHSQESSLHVRIKTPSDSPRSRDSASPSNVRSPSIFSNKERMNLIEYCAVYDLAGGQFKSTGIGTGRMLIDPDAQLRGKCVHRIPQVDNKTLEFPQGLELFVFPRGIRLYRSSTQSSFHSFVLTMADGERLYGFVYEQPRPLDAQELSTVRMQVAARIMADPSSTHTHDSLPKQLFAPRALCMLTSHPFLEQFEHLMAAYCLEYVSDEKGILNSHADDLFSMLTRQVTGAPTADNLLRISIGNVTALVPTLSGVGSHDRTIHVRFQTLFERLEPRYILMVFNALLCESSVVLVSAELSILTPCAEAISALLYPMKWPYIYIPVLPSSLTDIFEAPQPYLIGTLPEALSEPPWPVGLVVDLDNNAVSGRLPPPVEWPCDRNSKSNGRELSRMQSDLSNLSIHDYAVDDESDLPFHEQKQPMEALPWRLAWRLYRCIVENFNCYAAEHPTVPILPPYAMDRDGVIEKVAVSTQQIPFSPSKASRLVSSTSIPSPSVHDTSCTGDSESGNEVQPQESQTAPSSSPAQGPNESNNHRRFVARRVMRSQAARTGGSPASLFHSSSSTDVASPRLAVTVETADALYSSDSDSESDSYGNDDNNDGVRSRAAHYPDQQRQFDDSGSYVVVGPSQTATCTTGQTPCKCSTACTTAVNKMKRCTLSVLLGRSKSTTTSTDATGVPPGNLDDNHDNHDGDDDGGDDRGDDDAKHSAKTPNDNKLAPSPRVHRVDTANLRKGFVSVFVSLLKGYREYINIDAELSAKTRSVEQSDQVDDSTVSEIRMSLFDRDGFQREAAPDCAKFLKTVLQTQMFSCFIEDRVLVEADWFERLVMARERRHVRMLELHLRTTKCGILSKQGSRIPTWHERYFELEGMSLSYFKPDPDVVRAVKLQREAIAEIETLWRQKRALASQVQVEKCKLQELTRLLHMKGKFVLKANRTDVFIPADTERYPTLYPFVIRLFTDRSKVLEQRRLLCVAQSSAERRSWIKMIRARIFSERRFIRFTHAHQMLQSIRRTHMAQLQRQQTTTLRRTIDRFIHTVTSPFANHFGDGDDGGGDGDGDGDGDDDDDDGQAIGTGVDGGSGVLSNIGGIDTIEEI